MTNYTIGVDISKAHLDVFRLGDGAAQRFDNSAAGLLGSSFKCNTGRPQGVNQRAKVTHLGGL